VVEIALDGDQYRAFVARHMDGRLVLLAVATLHQPRPP
jgi:hypothetical protein